LLDEVGVAPGMPADDVCASSAAGSRQAISKTEIILRKKYSKADMDFVRPRRLVILKPL